jgi:D-3-phosphoglycerate dehydrogenase / 2-oxoglutarate reductase
MTKILANDGINKAGLQLLQDAGFTVDTTFIPQNELASKIADYDILLVRSATKVSKEIIDAATNLKLIGRGGVGIDNIDSVYAKSKGIPVVNTPTASSVSVAELVFAHLYSGCRFLNLSNKDLPLNPSGNFKDLKNAASKGIELKGKILGILGFGRIGQEVAKIAIGSGMNVLAYDPFFKSKDIEVSFHEALKLNPILIKIPMASKETVLQNSDFITLHVPGGPEAVIGAVEFEMMKKGAGLVNCARGGVVDEVAMTEALKNGKLAFAGVDVFAIEPPVYQDFIGLPNVSVSAHVGASTVEAQERIGKEIATIIINHFKN